MNEYKSDNDEIEVNKYEQYINKLESEIRNHIKVSLLKIVRKRDESGY